MTFGTTLTVIAIGQAISRAPTKLDGWMEGGVRNVVIQRHEPVTEIGGGLTSQVSLPTSSVDYTSAPMPMSRSDWLRAEIESYKALAAGWDGEGSIGPSNDAVEGAINLINHLPVGVVPPKAMVSSSGEIGFYWKADAFYADIVIEGKDIFSLFVRSRVNSGREFFYDELPISEDSSVLISRTFQQV